MLAHSSNRYLEMSVQTAAPATLLIMLYDGAIRFTRASIDALQKKNLEEVNRNLVKAQDIIKEFIITLDPESEISTDLNRLYEYFLFLLVEANRTKTVEPVEEVLGYLLELKETWLQAAKMAQEAAASVQHG